MMKLEWEQTMPSFIRICRPSLAAGTSLVEVMLALTLLTIAIGSLVSFAGTQSLSRASTEGQTQAAELARSLAERIQSARWEWLGTSRLPWSLGRYADGSGHEPMTLTSTTANLRTMGLVPDQVDLPNLTVYLEWYRGMDAVDDAGLPISGEPGVLTAGATTATQFRQTVRSSSTDPLSGFKSAYRPAVDGQTWSPSSLDSPTAYVQAGTPLAARILVRWGEQDERAVELITARSP